MRLGIAEILKKVNDAPASKRIEILQKYGHNNMALYTILKYTFDKRVVFLLPPGSPPYTENPYVDQHSNLYNEVRRFYLFVEGPQTNLTPVKREMLFIKLLENVDKEDAKIVIKMKDHQKPYPNITEKLINQAFPGMLEQEIKF